MNAYFLNAGIYAITSFSDRHRDVNKLTQVAKGFTVRTTNTNAYVIRCDKLLPVSVPNPFAKI